MEKPWNKHSSTWEVPWDDRYENSKIITVKNADGSVEKFIGNPARFAHLNVVGVAENHKAGFGAALACILFWVTAVALFLKFTPGLFV